MKSRNIIVWLAIYLLGGCATHYVTPGGGVSLIDAADYDLRAYYEKKPVSPFPSNLAVIRIQDSGYITKTNHGYGEGRYTIVTTRDIESDDAIQKFNDLPFINSTAALGRVLVPANANTIADLRTPAAMLRADMLLIYSVDTTFRIEGRPLVPLATITLGLLPNKKAHVRATVSGALIDVRTGFVYGTTEATSVEEQRASSWATRAAIDGSRIRAEQKAFESFVSEFGILWRDVLRVHANAQRIAGTTM